MSSIKSSLPEADLRRVVHVEQTLDLHFMEVTCSTRVLEVAKQPRNPAFMRS